MDALSFSSETAATTQPPTGARGLVRMSLVIRGGIGRETLVGGSADGDTFIGGGGGDYIIGGAGPDVVGFNPGNGQTWIDNFQIGVDKLQFGGGLTAEDISYQNLVIENVPGLAVYYNGLGGPDAVFLAGVTVTTLADTNLIFANLPAA